jgi:hypothetical protein
MSSNRWSPPKRKLSPLPKVPHLNLPIRPYDHTPEENARIAKEHYDAQMKKKKPEPRPEYTEKQKDYAKYLLMRVNSTNVQYEGLRIGGVGRWMNSKVKSVKQGVYRK